MTLVAVVRGPHTFTVTLPPEVAAAVDAEAYRRLVRRGDVLAEFVRTCWPTYLANVLAQDLASVLDAEEVDDFYIRPALMPVESERGGDADA